MINPYSYKPTPEFRRRQRESLTKLMFGVELECDGGPIEKRNPTSDKINDLTDRIYCKRDGSLVSGFEMVSHPCTLAYHMYDMPWNGITNKCKKAGFTSHDAGTCGLHIHVGREQLGATEDERDIVIRKVIVIVNRYWDELVKYTRRRRAELNQWASRNDIGDYTTDMEITDAWAARRIPTHDNFDNRRYHAINCQNRGTIEFRIFRGTLKRDTLIAAIQLVSNICEYAMAKSWDEIQHGTWLDVCRYRNYNENDAYLTAKGLAPACDRVYNTQRNVDFNGRS